MFPSDGLTKFPVVGNLEVALRTERREETFYGGNTLGSDRTPVVYTGKRDVLWTAGYENGFIFIQSPTGAVHKLIELPNVRELSVCFDQYMLPVIAYLRQSSVFLRYYDAFDRKYVTRNISAIAQADIITPRLCFDDRRLSYRNDACVLLAYYIGNRLCLRTSTDTYTTEKVLRTEPTNEVYLEQMAMGDNNRIHFITYTLVDPD